MADPGGPGLPLKQLAVMLAMCASDSIAFTQIFPYLAFLVAEAEHIPLADVGKKAGFLAASYSFAQFLSSYGWGYLSDRVGRRPVLLMGLVGTVGCTLLFGVAASHSFEAALAARALWGASNANVGVIKSMLGELLRPEQQARGFSLLGLSGGVGRIVGPMLGGFLARPALSWPGTFEGTLFEEFPYLLPSLAVAGIGVLGLALGLCYLQETRGMTQGRYSALSDSGGEQEEEEDDDDGRLSVFRDPKVLLPVALYSWLGTWSVVFWEVVPMWAVVAPARGVAFSQRDIGALNAVAGAAMLVFQLLLYPPLAARATPGFLFRLALWTAAPLLVALTLTPFLGSQGARFGVVALLFTAVQWCLLTAYTSVFQLIRMSTTEERLGAANGLGQSLVALGRTVGPVIGSTMLAWSLNNGMGYPLDEHLTFTLCAVLSVVNAVMARGT